MRLTESVFTCVRDTMKKMGNKVALLALVLVLCYGLAIAVSFFEDEDRRGEREGREEDRRREREGEGRKDWRREGEGEEEEGDWRREREKREEWSTEEGFLLQDSKRVVKTDAGEMEVVRSFVGKIVDRPLHIGFITMEPKTLFIPQYLDSSLVIFIRRGITFHKLISFFLLAHNSSKGLYCV